MVKPFLRALPDEKEILSSGLVPMTDMCPPAVASSHMFHRVSSTPAHSNTISASCPEKAEMTSFFNASADSGTIVRTAPIFWALSSLSGMGSTHIIRRLRHSPSSVSTQLPITPVPKITIFYWNFRRNLRF